MPGVLPCGRDALQNPVFSYPGSGLVMYFSVQVHVPSEMPVGLDRPGINKELWVRVSNRFLVTT